MNIALILAGGCGRRMGQDIPKQFININNRPVLVYTLQAFQRHPNIDAILVVCLEGWNEIVKAYSRQFNITKLCQVVTGGSNGQSSISNGLEALRGKFNKDDLILVHDAIRPMVSEEVISDCISRCLRLGSAVAAIPCATAMLTTKDQDQSEGCYDRDKLMCTQTPQAFPLGKLLWAHEEAGRRGITESVASCTLMLELGETVYFSAGSAKNIKLTTTDDIEIFRALLQAERISWMK